MPRNGKSRTHTKKVIAIQAVKDLESTLLSNQDSTILNSATNLILRIGKRHGIRKGGYSGLSICRKCKTALIPGRNSKLRIRSKSLKISCLDCNAVRTLGPSFMRD